MDENKISNLLHVYKETLKDHKLYLETRSQHWEKYYKNNQKFLNPENLKNFRNNRILSNRLDDAENVQNKLNLIEVLDYFDGEFLKENLPVKNVGNCSYSINFMGYYFDYGIAHHLKWYEKIEKYISDGFCIMEIGGGFGSLARIIIKNKNVKYFLVDLPEANLMSNYYLQSHFPEKKIFNYLNFKEYEIEEQISKFDIFILPPNALNNKNIFFDFIINTRSFIEMKKETINEYFNLIQKKINHNGYFLNINRYLKSTVGENIYFKEYPYDNFWDVVISEKSFLQEHSHFLLTVRKKNKGNIQNEMKNIDQIGSLFDKKNLLKIPYLNQKIKRRAWLIIRKLLLLFVGKKSLLI